MFCLTLTLLSVGAAQVAFADQYSDYGIALIKRKRYAEAQKYFNERLKLVPNDATALYFKAVSLHYAGKREAAKEAYAKVCEEHPSSQYAQLSLKHLKKMEGNTEKDDVVRRPQSSSRTAPVSPQAASSEAAPEMSMPDQDRVYYRTSGRGNNILVDASINGRTIEMTFDTGAHGVLVGKSDLQQLGLRLPDKAPVTESSGVGGKIKGHTMTATIALGRMSREIPITVSDDWHGRPLLGQSFFGDLEFEFDHKAHCIIFRRSEEKAEKDHYTVPFTRNGNHLMVDVQVAGGKKTSMIVDTGAESIAFTESNLKDLGLTIPEDARRTWHHGVGGMAPGFSFSINELRLGPIVQRSPTVSVIMNSETNSGPPKGLLGMDFFRSWRYTIDNKNQCLRFFH